MCPMLQRIALAYAHAYVLHCLRSTFYGTAVTPRDIVRQWEGGGRGAATLQMYYDNRVLNQLTDL
jgi:hypothetical protein